jgi:hypothetical protein
VTGADALEVVETLASTERFAKRIDRADALDAAARVLRARLSADTTAKIRPPLCLKCGGPV